MRRFLFVLAPSLLVSGLMITLHHASASAVTEGHSRHVIVHRSQDYAVPGWVYATPRSAVHYNDTPSYDDPSKWGGENALPATR